MPTKSAPSRGASSGCSAAAYSSSPEWNSSDHTAWEQEEEEQGREQEEEGGGVGAVVDAGDTQTPGRATARRASKAVPRLWTLYPYPSQARECHNAPLAAGRRALAAKAKR